MSIAVKLWTCHWQKTTNSLDLVSSVTLFDKHVSLREKEYFFEEMKTMGLLMSFAATFTLVTPQLKTASTKKSVQRYMGANFSSKFNGRGFLQASISTVSIGIGQGENTIFSTLPCSPKACF